MEPTSPATRFPEYWEANLMNRSVASRAFAVFTTITVLATIREFHRRLTSPKRFS